MLVTTTRASATCLTSSYPVVGSVTDTVLGSGANARNPPTAAWRSLARSTVVIRALVRQLIDRQPPHTQPRVARRTHRCCWLIDLVERRFGDRLEASVVEPAAERRQRLEIRRKRLEIRQRKPGDRRTGGKRRGRLDDIYRCRLVGRPADDAKLTRRQA